MYYCLYDLLNEKRTEKGETSQEMYRFFQGKKIKKADIVQLKDTCSIGSVKKILPAIEEYTGMTELEVYLSLGIIPEEYKKSFFDNITSISQMLVPESKQRVTGLSPIFSTQFGTLYNADCLDVLSMLPDESVNVVFADPPFNLSKEYDTGIKDDLGMSEYISWSYKWLGECVRILKPGGSMFIYNLPKWGTYYADFLNKYLTFRSWIGVNMKASLPIAGRLYPAHYALLYYVKGGQAYTFNNQRIPAETCRHCGGELHDYGGYKNKMNPSGVNVSDIWSDIYPVRHKKDKNRPFNELSVKMLDRIISMSSNPGDTVFDPFGGSGTTYVVSELLGRNWIGSELGNCKIITDRFANIQRDRDTLSQVQQREKNILFSEPVRILRKKNGFWLPEDFKK